MNRKYDGNMVVYWGLTLKGGKQSKAAKSAFKDILSDPNMQVLIGTLVEDGNVIEVPIILNEKNCIILKND